MNQGSASALIEELGRSVGLPALQLDAQGCCQLVFDKRWLVTLSLHPSGERLMLHCPICATHAPAMHDVAALQVMLQANFMGCAALGGSLAVTPDLRACVQSELRLAGAGVDALRTCLEQLLMAAETWARRLEQPIGESARQPAAHLLSQRA